jgi:diaminopimelate epimerase
VLPFVKLHTCGNDFVLLDGFSHELPPAPRWGLLALQLCERRRGVGGDELLFVRPGPDGADFELSIWNPDGTEATACGNAILAAGYYYQTVRDGRPCPPQSESNVAIWTYHGIRTVMVGSDYVRAVLARPALWGPPDGMQLEAEGMSLRGLQVDTGTKHLVLEVPDLSTFPVERIGPMLEGSPALSAPSNVMFIQRVQPGRFRMRPWEKAGTGETLACGTGACAAAHALRHLGLDGSSSFVVDSRGGSVRVDFSPDGSTSLTARSVVTLAGRFNLPD